MKEDWLTLKKYPHIGLPIRYLPAILYVKRKENIETHKFSPFIRREVIKHPYKVDKNGKRKRTSKKREITYASHLDSAIFSYYANKLQTKYEGFIKEENLTNVAVAYRKIPCENGYGNKCNIHIAKDVFSFVKDKTQTSDVAVLTFDIKGFFDNLDHSIIKKNWEKIMGYDNCLPRDEYQVFKNITKYAYVLESDLFSLFKDSIICKNNDGINQKKIKWISDTRRKNAIAFCTPKDIKIIREKGLLHTYRGTKGIPQGLSISAVIANLYMCDFDKKINELIKKDNGIYKRYSDDIVIVCSIEKAMYWRDYVVNEIQCVNLEIQPEKTNVFYYKRVKNDVVCSPDNANKKKQIEYLGFTFDGKRILLKNATIGNYYHKMFIDKRRHKHWAISINNPTNGNLFVSQIVKRYTLAGAKRHYIRIKRNGYFRKTKDKTFGNFLTYVYKASTIINEPAIKRQLRRNLHKVKENIEEIYSDVRKIKEMYGY